jgi:hypothetical protein
MIYTNAEMISTLANRSMISSTRVHWWDGHGYVRQRTVMTIIRAHHHMIISPLQEPEIDIVRVFFHRGGEDHFERGRRKVQ